MSEGTYPIVQCDGLHELGCHAFELDHTLGGLAKIEGSATQLPDGWTGPKPGQSVDGPHLCPSCTQEAAEATS